MFFQVKPFTPREFTCEGMLERVHGYITHQVQRRRDMSWHHMTGCSHTTLDSQDCFKCFYATLATDRRETIAWFEGALLLTVFHVVFMKSFQDFCSKSVPTWPPESALRMHLGPLGQSCVSVCRRSSLVCEPALFHHLNSPSAFTRWRITRCTLQIHFTEQQ